MHIIVRSEYWEWKKEISLCLCLFWLHYYYFDIEIKLVKYMIDNYHCKGTHVAASWGILWEYTDYHHHTGAPPHQDWLILICYGRGRGPRHEMNWGFNINIYLNICWCGGLPIGIRVLRINLVVIWYITEFINV